MSTSGEAVLRDGRVVRLRAVPYDDPVARELVARVQAEYTERYGGPDAAAVDPAEFLPPAGLFLIAAVDGAPAGCGAWRGHEAGVGGGKRGDGGPPVRPPGRGPAAARGGCTSRGWSRSSGCTWTPRSAGWGWRGCCSTRWSSPRPGRGTAPSSSTPATASRRRWPSTTVRATGRFRGTGSTPTRR